MSKLDQSGFSAIEGILIIVILAIIGGTGWYVWHSKQTTDKVQDETSQTASLTPTKPSGNSQDLVISGWAVQLPMQDASKMTAEVSDKSGSFAGQFDYTGVAKLMVKPQYLTDTSCELGLALYRTDQKPADFSSKQVGGSYYLITGSPVACGSNSSPSPDDSLNATLRQEISIDHLQSVK